MESNIFYVYALVDPINKLPFYIGKGKNNRAWDHIKGYDEKNYKKKKYINNIRMLGFEPEVHIIIENLSNDYALKYEGNCILYGKKIGLPLTNIKTFEGGHNWSKESRKKVSETMKRKGLQPPSRKGLKKKHTILSTMDKELKNEIVEMWLTKEYKNKDIQAKFNLHHYKLKDILNEAGLLN